MTYDCEDRAMATNTLIGADDDIGDTVDTFVFDLRLARSLLSVSGLVVAGSAGAGTGVVALHLFGRGSSMTILLSAVVIISGAVGAWGVVVAGSRLARRNDRFVVHRRGFARHHDGSVVHTRWSDIETVTETGTNRGSRLARWSGADYLCRIERRDGVTTTFDNYIVDAAVLGREVETHVVP